MKWNWIDTGGDGADTFWPDGLDCLGSTCALFYLLSSHSHHRFGPQTSFANLLATLLILCCPTKHFPIFFPYSNRFSPTTRIFFCCFPSGPFSIHSLKHLSPSAFSLPFPLLQFFIPSLHSHFSPFCAHFYLATPNFLLQIISGLFLLAKTVFGL